MNNVLRNVVGIAGLIVASQAAAQVTFYQNDGFHGRSLHADRQIANFERFGFNDRASSAVVRGGTWEACEDARFQGRCVVLKPGRYRSLREMGLNDRISSVRPADIHARRRDDRTDHAYDYRFNARERESINTRGRENGNESGM